MCRAAETPGLDRSPARRRARQFAVASRTRRRLRGVGPPVPEEKLTTPSAPSDGPGRLSLQIQSTQGLRPTTKPRRAVPVSISFRPPGAPPSDPRLILSPKRVQRPTETFESYAAWGVDNRQQPEVHSCPEDIRRRKFRRRSPMRSNEAGRSNSVKAMATAGAICGAQLAKTTQPSIPHHETRGTTPSTSCVPSSGAPTKLEARNAHL